MWDWKTGYNFQRTQALVQPGSLDSESGVFSMTFDHSGTRLITTEADKTIKIYKEDDEAVSNFLLSQVPGCNGILPSTGHVLVLSDDSTSDDYHYLVLMKFSTFQSFWL